MSELKHKDFVIVQHIRDDARVKLTKISKNTGIPVSTIFDRLQFFKEGLIKRTTALVNFQKLGFNMVSSIVLRVKKEERNELRDFLMNHPNVNNLYRINNGYDYFVECIFRTMRDFEEFSELLEQSFDIKAKQTYYIIEDLKREEFLSSEEHIKMIQG